VTLDVLDDLLPGRKGGDEETCPSFFLFFLRDFLYEYYLSRMGARGRKRHLVFR